MNNQILKAACSLMLMRRTPIEGVRGAFLYSSATGPLLQEGILLEGLTLTQRQHVKLWDKGVAVDLNLQAYSVAQIYSGGIMRGGHLHENATAHIYEGGEMIDTWSGSIYHESIITVHDGGVATRVTISKIYNASTGLQVLSGGVANFCEISGGGATIFAGGIANNCEMKLSCSVRPGGVINDCIITRPENMANVSTFIQGVANRSMVYGKQIVAAGGVSNDTQIFSDTEIVYDGGISNYPTVKGGFLYVESGGISNYPTVKDGRLHVYSGGAALNVFTTNGWRVTAEPGATVTYRSQE